MTQSYFLADRTNGRAYATVLRLSVCLSVCLSVVCDGSDMVIQKQDSFKDLGVTFQADLSFNKKAVL